MSIIWLPLKYLSVIESYINIFIITNCIFPRKWIPGCGIRLIAKDYTIFTQFGDLTPTQLVELFKEFKSWPEYSESNFLTSMNYLNVQNELGAVEELADLEDNLKIDE